ncbi:major facilitator transporter [Sinomonas atrocyanea]|uniref:Putative proline/betaine transporter n=1 Tax=Sinomonas atrocyanea TaxID=37927 RepID=A0A126ZXM7_9MICC|nr:MFS transporter [Sinomonas atrocyanea]AMM31863.1 major facilitator transporter [Sinomonas atrocyanea]GEB65518.1 MFS transporter [Sinomonas atrocyanea]GGG74204.1 MFS transporter [Sinomonas atrocyanea]
MSNVARTTPATTASAGHAASSAASVQSPGAQRKTPKKAALASFLGSTLEYYDFFIYGTAAALVFPALFFPGDNPTAGLVAAFATFGVAYVARPLGGMVMGHFGDRLGRRNVLLVTLTLMGLASLGIGFLPTYSSVGLLAPVLLTLGRLLQGFSAGAESAGASTLTLEHSPEGRRGFFTSFVMAGYASGMVLATVVFVPITALPKEDLMAWGWRVPFWCSAAVLAIAYWVRTHLEETPVFEEARAEGDVRKLPLGQVLRYQAADVVRVLFMSIFSVMQTIFTVFGLSYATAHGGLDKGAILTINAVAIGLSMLVMPPVAALSDRVGRKPLLIISMLGCSGALFAYFWALGTGNLILVAAASFVFMTVLYSGFNGVWPGFFAELFAAPVRYSGMALGNQLGLLVAGFGPMIGGLLMTVGPTGWVPVAVFGAVCALAAVVAVVSSRETAHTPVDELGGPYLKAVSGRPTSTK